MDKKITAQRLREALDNKGMRAQELANKSGIDKSSISQQLSGRHAPSEETAKKYASILNVDYLWLMGHDAITTDAMPIRSAYRNLLSTEMEYIDELQRYMSKLNDKGIEQVAKYIQYVASQEEYRK